MQYIKQKYINIRLYTIQVIICSVNVIYTNIHTDF